MKTMSYSPDKLAILASAFEHAWAKVKNGATEQMRDSVREVIGRAVFDLAQAGDTNVVHLTNYAAYQGRFFIDMKGSEAAAGMIGRRQ